MSNSRILIKSTVIKKQLNIIKNELKINNQLYLSFKNLFFLFLIPSKAENSNKLTAGAEASNKIPNLKSFEPMFFAKILIEVIFFKVVFLILLISFINKFKKNLVIY